MNARAFSRISDYLATHAALVTIVVCFLINRNNDKQALIRSKSDLEILVNAMREALEVLSAAGYRITPTNSNAIKIIPRFMLSRSVPQVYDFQSRRRSWLLALFR